MGSSGVADHSISWFNELNTREAVDGIRSCCQSAQFAALVAGARPFGELVDLVQHTRNVWWTRVGVPGWLEAFAGHPRIGDVEGLREKFGASADFSEGEQGSALASADDSILQELSLWNKKYEDKFGHVFLICASGKTSQEVLEAVKARFSNCPHEEIRIAALEQQKITELRLEKLLASHAQSAAHPSEGTVLLPTPTATTSQNGTKSAGRVVWPHDEGGVLETRPGTRGAAHGRLAQIGDHLTAGRGSGASSESRQGETRDAGASPDKGLNCEPHRLSMQPAAGATVGLRSPITTHVLDLSHGRPAHGVAVELQVLRSNCWLAIGQGETDADGRVVNLMAAAEYVAPGVYKLRFETGAYLQNLPSSERGDPGRVGADGGFYPLVEIVFEVKPSQTQEHFHVPLIFSPYSYTTYRGS